MKKFILFLSIAVGVACLPVLADTLSIRPDAPHRYTVVSGDTLWTISERFLKDPWQWPRIWNHNQQIHNPHLIYPGDVILLTYNKNGEPELTVLPQGQTVGASTLPPAAGAAAPAPTGPSEVTEETSQGPVSLPVVTLKPSIQSAPYSAPVPTIKPEAIQPFLYRTDVMTRRELDRAPYVLAGTAHQRLLGSFSEFFAKGFRDSKTPLKDGDLYDIVRPTKPLKSHGRVLGYEVLHLGRAAVTAVGPVATLQVMRASREIMPGDRLVPAPKPEAVPYYYPQAPAKQVDGSIISALQSMNDLGPGTVVALDLGADRGMRKGDVLMVMRHTKPVEDPVTGREVDIPDQRSGLVMVFRVFHHVSYALVMEATRPVRIGDHVKTP